MSELIQALFKVFTEFTWRRMAALLAITIMFGAGLLAYERYTGNLMLGRLERSSRVLSSLHLLQKDGISKDTLLYRTYTSLAKQLYHATSAQPFTPDVAKLTNRFQDESAIYKFVAGSAAWFVLLLIALADTLKGNSEALTAIDGLLFLGLLGGIVGLLLPTYHTWVVNYVIYPIVSFVTLLGLVVWRARIKENVKS